MSGDAIPRKRKGKGKRKDEAEHDNGVIKGSHKGSYESEGNGSAAKLVFVVLLLALSIVIGLLIVELRAGLPVERESIRFGEKRAAPPVVVKEQVEVVQPAVEEIPEAEELLEPEPEIPIEEAEPEIPIEEEEDDEEEVEIPVEHQETPPLDSVVEVVEVVEVPEEVEPEPQVVEVVEEVVVLDTPEDEIPVDEPQVVEVVEEVTVFETPEEQEPQIVEVVEEIIEEPEVIKEIIEEPEIVEEVIEVVEIEEPAPEEPVVMEVAEELETVEEILPEADADEIVEEPEVVEEVAPVDVESVVEQVEIVEEPEDDAAPVEVIPEPEVVEALAEDVEVVPEVLSDAPADPIELKEEVVEAVEPAAEVVEAVEPAAEVVEAVEEPAAEVVEAVEEPAAEVEAVEELAAEVVEEPAAEVVEAVEEPAAEVETTETVSEPIVEAVEELKPEAPVPEAPAASEEDKVLLDIHETYVRTEAMADEVLALDPGNQMVTQLAPHLQQVLDAMEKKELDGLMDTLNHIQTILVDVRGRIEGQAVEQAEEAPAQDAPAPAEPEVYEKADITSPVDDKVRDSLDKADRVLEQDPQEALNMYGAILHFNPKSARATYGRARCLDRLAELLSSNSKLEQAIMTYRNVIDLADEDANLVPLPLLRLAAEKCIERMRFRGFLGKAVRVQQRLLQRFPEDLDVRNQLGVTYLLMNQATAAKEVFQEVLRIWPDNGFAQVHYGFVLKTTYNNNSGGAEFLRRGIESGVEGTQDGRFYFHLGDALQRQGLQDEAYQVYDNAVEKGLFLNRYQRSLYNVDRLTSRPVWTLDQTTHQEFFKKLEENWEAIRDEGVALLSEPPQDGYRPEAENLRDTGDWKQYELFSRGRKLTANCVKAPKTCEIVKYAAATSCKRGQIKFSVMLPGTHVWPHTGPTNCRLRAHLGLVVPPQGLQLRVGHEKLTWQQGKVVVFDDSWEHEVWHNGTSPRLILIVDIWHPELTEDEWKTLSPI